MTLYWKAGFTSAELGAALAAVVAYEIETNRIPVNGFPQISVDWKDNAFEAAIKFDDLAAPAFSMTESEAKAAVKALRDGKGYLPELCQRVQEAAVAIERQLANRNGSR